MAKILIADDQPYVRELLSEELLNEGYEISDVGDANSLWRHLVDSQPDLVLLDLYFVGFQGFDFLHDIKRLFPNLPVLIVTGYDTFRDDPRLAQADGYWIKDFVHFDLIKREVDKILKNNVRR